MNVLLLNRAACIKVEIMLEFTVIACCGSRDQVSRNDIKQGPQSY